MPVTTPIHCQSAHGPSTGADTGRGTNPPHRSPSGGASLVGRTAAILTLLVMGAGLLTIPGTAWAGGIHNQDAGVRKISMSTIMGKPDDSTAIFHNPAGLTLQKGTQTYFSGSLHLIDMGYRLYDSQLVLHPADREISPTSQYGISPFVSVSTDLGTEKLRVAMGIYAPTAFGAKMPEDEPTKYHVLNALFVTIHTTFAAAWEFSKQFSIGAGASISYTTMEMEQIINPMVLANPDLRFDNSPAVTNGDMHLHITGQDVAAEWKLGLLFNPTDRLGIGASFTSGMPVKLEGDLTLTPPEGESLTTTQVTEMAIPFTLRGGVNLELTPQFELGWDVTWWHYQVLQEQRTQFGMPIMGMTGMRVPKNYGNSWQWSVGILHKMTKKIDVMAGFRKDYSPTPTATLTLDNPTQDMSGVSLGTRWRPNDRITLGLGAIRYWFDLIDVTDNINNPPFNAKGHGSILSIGADAMARF